MATTTAPSPWWLADYPRDIENLYIRPFDNEKTIDDEVKISAWVRVEKKSIKPAPDLPSELIEWINEVNPLEQPKAKEKIDRNLESFKISLEEGVSFVCEREGGQARRCLNSY